MTRDGTAATGQASKPAVPRAVASQPSALAPVTVASDGSAPSGADLVYPPRYPRLLTGLSPRRRLGFAAIAGALAGLGQAPVDLWPLTILALAFVQLLTLPTTRARQAAVVWWAAGSGYFALSLSWIVEPFLVDVARHGWMAPFALIFMATGLALFWGAAGALARALVRSRGAAFAVATVLAFLLMGWLRGVIFTGFPWALPGHVLIPTPALAFAQWGGAMGLGALVLTLATTLPLTRLRPGLGLPIWALALAAIMGIGHLATPAPGDMTGRPVVRIVQPNVPQDEKWDPLLARGHFDRTLAMTEAPGSPDLVVWPETSVPAWLDQVPDLMPVLSASARDVPMVFGINRGDDDLRIYNSLVQLSAGGEIAQIYDKHHLVPFGEFIPLGDLLGGLGLRGLAQRDGNGFSPGPGAQLIIVPGIGPMLPLICYEGVFARDIHAAPARGQALLLITNDAWFGTVSGPYQHLAQARLRAVEQGLPMIRAANTGISAMIDPAGRLIDPMALGTAGIRDVPLPPARPAPVYARIGDLPLVGLVIVALLTLVAGARSNARRFRVDGPSGRG